MTLTGRGRKWNKAMAVACARPAGQPHRQEVPGAAPSAAPSAASGRRGSDACPPPSSADVLVPSEVAFCRHRLVPQSVDALDGSMSGCLVMHKRMTPLAGAVNWS